MRLERGMGSIRRKFSRVLPKSAASYRRYTGNREDAAPAIRVAASRFVVWYYLYRSVLVRITRRTDGFSQLGVGVRGGEGLGSGSE